jgi:hypothetical protein
MTDKRTMTDKIGYRQMSVSEIVEHFKVSERTARRHRAVGTLPSSDRVKTIRNGKMYTVPRHQPDHVRTRYWSRLSTDLYMARDAVRRVSSAERFTDADLRLAMQIYDEVAALADGWRSRVPTTSTI